MKWNIKNYLYNNIIYKDILWIKLDVIIMKDCIKLKLWIKGKNIFNSAHVYSFLKNALFLNIKVLNLKY